MREMRECEKNIDGKREATVYNQASRMREETKASGLRNGVEKRASEREKEKKRERQREEERGDNERGSYL